MEGLQIKEYECIGKGNIEEPGRNVKAKSGLNKSILDQGGLNSGGSLNTSSFGREGCWLRSIPGIPHSDVHVVGTRQKKTEYHRLFSDARYVGMRKMQM